MQIISTIALYNYKVPVIVKKNNFTFCPGKSRENSINIFQDFPGLTNKIQGLSRTFQDTKKNPGLSRTFPGCGNPGFKWEIGALVRLCGMITVLVLAGLTDGLFKLHHKRRWRSFALRLTSSFLGFEPYTNKHVSTANNLGSLSNALCRS